MEACGSANYWGRVFEGMGHKARLIPAQYVKPFVKRQKNDAHDALAICEASQRPDFHDVPLKTIEQLDLQMTHRIRQRHVKNKTAISNQIRALLREYGIILSKNISHISIDIPFILEDADNGLSMVARNQLRELYADFKRELQPFQGEKMINFCNYSAVLVPAALG